MKNIHTFVVLAYKQSPYLEQCIKSVTHQRYGSAVVIATSTPNAYISALAAKYGLRVAVNHGEKGIGPDFDFALSAADTELITIAHQDDVYDYDYSAAVVDYHRAHGGCSIIFTRYYDIKGSANVYKSLNFTVKNILLWPLNISRSSRFCKRLSLALGDPIGCPAVTFVNGHFNRPVFGSGLKCNVDWAAWEQLSRQGYAFGYVKQPLMGHRIHTASTTSEIIEANLRTQEDFLLFQRFWPKPIAKLLARLYRNSERNNDDPKTSTA